MPLWLRLVVKAAKRGGTGLSGDLDVVTPLASCPWSGDERTSELSRAKTGQREVMGLVQTGHGCRGGRVIGRPPMHSDDVPADSADLPAAPHG
jgi:hypothetical protein